MKSDVDVDVRNQRWLADIESDGSVLKNLSGRSAVIADGLSRAPHDLTPELADRARAIREFRVEDFMDLLEEPGALQVDTLPGHSPPTPDSSPGEARAEAEPSPVAAYCASVGSPLVVEVVLVEDHAKQGQYNQKWFLEAVGNS